MYNTYSELKAVVVERFNLTYNEWLDKENTDRELMEQAGLLNNNPQKQKFNLKKPLQKFIEYYNNHNHSIVKMNPNDVHKKEYEKEVRHKYILKYKLKHDNTVKYDVDDLVKIF